MNASIGTLIKDVRKKLTETPEAMNFDPKNYSMNSIADILAKFLGEVCDELAPAAKLQINAGFLIGGYSSGGDLGESWSVEIKQGVAQPSKQLREPKDAGVFAPMPIQDAIDLGRFLVHAASMFSRFTPGANVVGGPVEIAAITKHENFKWISRKHYYDQSLNKEPIHVICDR